MSSYFKDVTQNGTDSFSMFKYNCTVYNILLYEYRGKIIKLSNIGYTVKK